MAIPPKVPHPGRDPERTRRALGDLSAMINPLLLNGILVPGRPADPFTFGITGLLYSGSGAPSNSLAVNGDYYLRTSNGAVYKKASGSWSVIFTPTTFTQVGATVKDASTQSIADNTAVALTFPTVVVDDASFWSSGAQTKLTAATAGWYTIAATCQWAVHNSGQRRLALKINGTTEIASTTFISGAAGNDPTQNVAMPWKFAANDYVEAYAFQNGIGIALNVTTALMSIMS